MKRIIYALLSSSLFSSAVSATESSRVEENSTIYTHFAGFYAGGLLGYGSGKAQRERTNTRNGNIDLFVFDDISLSGANGGLVLGYGKMLGASKIYVGLDFAFTLSRSRGNAISTEIRQRDSFEVTSRLGVVLGNAMPFIKLGLASSKIEGRARMITEKFLDKRLNGFMVGAGMDTKLTQRIIVGLDYSYTIFPKSGKLTPIASNIAIDSNNNRNTKIKLASNTVRLKIAYKF